MADSKRVHFIGIGGSGMSAIAWIAYKNGMQVSGSDLKMSKYAKPLVEVGVPIAIGQSADNITDDIDIVVVSTAILDNNPELIEAKRRGLEIWHRTRMLTEISRGLTTISISGTHGKTTTSSLFATSLDRLGADPSFLIGGIVEGYDSNARYGNGEYFVVEADESDRSFLAFDNRIAIVTNIEKDHLDRYSGIEEIREAFGEFMGRVTKDGCSIVCSETDGLIELAHASCDRVITYGYRPEDDYRCIPGERGYFTVEDKKGNSATLRLKTNPGRHNMLNATSVIAGLVDLGYSFQDSVAAVEAFEGVHRRFELVGEADGVTVIDDYGHHPTEIAQTTKAAKELGFNRVHVLFQPHHFARTHDLRDEFGECFDEADTATLMEIYAPAEIPIPGVTGKILVDAVLEHNPRMAVGWVPHRSDVVPYLMTIVKPGDMLLVSGAGDIASIEPKIMEALRKREANR